MSLITWLSLAGICLLGAMAPGPSLAVVVRNTVRNGRAGGLATAIAHGIAVGCYALLTVGGLALALRESPALFTALQLGGAAWLLHLGLRGLREAAPGVTATLDDTLPPGPLGRDAAEGFLIAFLNPKIALFMLALFSQFLPATANLGTHTLMVATIVCTDAGWYSLVAMLLSRPRWLQRLRSRAWLIDRLLSTPLALLGAGMLLHSAWQLVIL
ncbi:MAG: lysine transporter LysE [Haliea sp.]|nr:lysine transporter LysE [Haliea sp.]